MKTQTRGQHREHLAKQRMRALRGETTKPQGAHGDLNVLVFGGRDAVTGRAVETCCKGCGYHVCSCPPKTALALIDEINKQLTEVCDDLMADYFREAARRQAADRRAESLLGSYLRGELHKMAL